MVARVIPVEPFDLVIFGATGDLARRKILDALSVEIATQSCRTLRHGKVLTFAIVTFLLSFYSLGKKTLQLLSFVRFGR